ncbi:hypothetical protein HN695_01465 [Candidatus Woesearchaeota archaeon]|jgi:uncharacterized protein|nr:hypothetical protein [Candidatus Woesearchaeota archaeon]MBT5273068.1 hypothetical protein [Candidatus Woesearchaeota archaeon]MBT6041007.1 hypothetical protein [Candidatus Woesearchaeota archaeon]MBT6337617.1 hypothetical protein [Candidatus Woesearchaeota archaeon]MBT7926982.1 hypothetical protein [Candidatus Woesearchaeota archaeon]
MPHRCVRCSKIHDDGSAQILKGCDCGCKLFFFIKKSALEKKEEPKLDLSEKEKDQIENDVCDIIGMNKEDLEHPVILDLETVNILQPGKFEVDLVRLFNKKNPLVYKLEDGKYMIDLAESFKREKEKKEE